MDLPFGNPGRRISSKLIHGNAQEQYLELDGLGCRADTHPEKRQYRQMVRADAAHFAHGTLASRRAVIRIFRPLVRRGSRTERLTGRYAPSAALQLRLHTCVGG